MLVGNAHAAAAVTTGKDIPGAATGVGIPNIGNTTSHRRSVCAQPVLDLGIPADLRIDAACYRRSMSLRSNVAPAITCVLLLIFCGGMAWVTARGYAAELRSYNAEELTTVTLDGIRVTPRQVSLEVRVETFIDVVLRVRGADGVPSDLSATFVGETPEHLADIKHLASSKNRQIQLRIEPSNPRGFSLHHEFPLYRAGPLLIWSSFVLLGAWGLYWSVKSQRDLHR